MTTLSQRNKTHFLTSHVLHTCFIKSDLNSKSPAVSEYIISNSRFERNKKIIIIKITSLQEDTWLEEIFEHFKFPFEYQGLKSIDASKDEYHKKEFFIFPPFWRPSCGPMKRKNTKSSGRTEKLIFFFCPCHEVTVQADNCASNELLEDN